MSVLANNGVSGSNGYPMQLRKIALLNGNGAGLQDYTAGALCVDLRGKQFGREIFKWKNWFMPNSYSLASNTELAITIAPRYYAFYFIGHLPHIYYGGNNITNTNLSGSMDVVPGSNYNSMEKSWNQFVAVLNATTTVSTQYNFLTKRHTFIPTISALGFYNPNFTWSTRVDDRNLVCTNNIPFDNYYIPKQNEQHITLTPDNVAWLKQEVYKGGTVSNCPVFCAYADNWPTTICNGSTITLSIANLPPNTPASRIHWDAPYDPNWSPPNLSVSNLNSSHTSADVTANLTYANSPYKTIRVTIDNPCGADYIIEKKIDIIKIYGLTPTITAYSTPTSHRFSIKSVFPTPPTGVSTSWDVCYYRRPTLITCDNGNDGYTVSKTLNTGDTVVWGLSATGLNGCGSLEDNGAFVVVENNGNGGLTPINFSLARMAHSSTARTLSVSPNPSNATWTFSFSNSARQPMNIAITDIAGKKMYIMPVRNIYNESISCSEFAKGLYIGTVHYDDGTTETLKLQKE